MGGVGDTGDGGKEEARREFPNAAAYRREIRRIYNGRTCPSLSPSLSYSFALALGLSFEWRR